MSCYKFKIGLVAATTLVVLRVGIGYHFFKEGYSHYQDPKWSSEPFRKGAKGPLAKWYQEPIADFHGWTQNLLQPHEDPTLAEQRAKAAKASEAGKKETDNGAKTPEKSPAPADKSAKPDAAQTKPDPAQAKLDQMKARPYFKWHNQVSADWNAWQREVAAQYGFKADQQKAAALVHTDYLAKLDLALAEYDADIRAYQHELYRTSELAKRTDGPEVPFQKKRIGERERDPTAEKGVFGVNTKPAAWMSDAKAVEKDYEAAILGLVTKDQQDKFGPLVQEPTSVQKSDRLLTYSLLAIGICLMAGFLTPLAALGGAGFLLSVVTAQPPWLPDSMPTYNQWVELLALLVLAASCAGRFAGLDYFLAKICSCCCKGDSSCN